ncbi:unnamed protein product [Sordaria macrospora k-hell]|uniref:WGS project CABT00000000 data, contig 2.5 n=1 Tax=Sordaria macrospora (strain ATCC MYA-333 / DSM 997 / K(L3346) / K-hell) TaxID=771870 RepID=F7VSA2_SORMK|nr:uncharacterized protein SMAC_12101 [Sordaria macrospora k-hell]CCC08388.1 unnamed protein product [Sordaria macrospora k-hell]
MGGSAHHEPFKALGPVSWPTDLAGRPDSDLQALLTLTFSDAQTLVDSIPIPPSVAAAHKTAAGRTRSATDSVVTSHHTTGSHQHPPKLSAEAAETATKLRKEWKECKVSSPKENPLGINVYKLSSKDGKGAWFARRSVHKDMSFDKWRAGLEREFVESIKRYQENGTEPGTGNIRGIGGERRIERIPGPTTPRDFVTCLMMPGHGNAPSKKGGPRQPRQFMLVSRPCEHPDAPARSNFIRGQYESVEVIREIPLDRPLRKTKSSTELSREEFHEVKDALDQAGVDDIKKEAVLRSAKQASAAAADGADDRGRSSFKGDEDDQQFAVEWLMVTRSDPGGSVPRFMVERGTPGGITNDAARFVDWLSTMSIEELTGSSDDEVPEKTIETVPTPGATTTAPNQIKRKEVPVQQKRAPGVDKVNHAQSPLRQTEAVEEETPASQSSGLYGMLTGALGAAGNAVANKVSNFAGTTNDTEDDTASLASSTSSSDIESDTSSIRSFVSATEGEGHAVNASGQSVAANGVNDDITNDLTNATSIRSDLSATESASSLQPITTGENGSIHLPDHYSARREKHEKELRKLEERHRKAEEKLHRLQAKQAAKRREQEEKGLAAAAAAAALDDDTASKHSKSSKAAHEDARLAKLEQHRLREERKAKEKLRKAAEKEEKANVLREMEKVKAERDLALRQMEMLREQVGELQRQNTMLAARLGKYEGPAAGSEAAVVGESQAPVVKNGNGVVGA